MMCLSLCNLQTFLVHTMHLFMWKETEIKDWCKKWHFFQKLLKIRANITLTKQDWNDFNLWPRDISFQDFFSRLTILIFRDFSFITSLYNFPIKTFLSWHSYHDFTFMTPFQGPRNRGGRGGPGLHGPGPFYEGSASIARLRFEDFFHVSHSILLLLLLLFFYSFLRLKTSKNDWNQF